MKPTTLFRPRPSKLSAALLVMLVGCSGGGGGSDAEQIAAAKAMLEKKDVKAAVIQLKSALQKNPKSAEGRLLLGKTLLENGDGVTALVELQKAQELQVADDLVIPEIARAMVLVGEHVKLLGQYGSTVLKGEVPNADLKTSLAIAAAVKGDMPTAQQSIDQALRFKPGYAPAIVMQARIRASDGQLDAALAELDKVLTVDPGEERAGILKGEYLLLGKRDPEAALVALRTVIGAHPDSFGAHTAAGNILFQQNKITDAKAEFEQLKKLSPNHPETLLLEANLAFAAGDLKATREITTRLLKGAPENIRVLELAGATELRAKNYIQAEGHLSQVLKLSPKQPRARLLLAQSLLRSGQAEKVLELLKPTLESPRPDAMTLSLAGEAYLQTGDNKRSEEAFRLATLAAPNSTAVRTSAAIAQIARGDSSSTAMSELESVAGNDKGTRGDLALVSVRLQKNDLAGALKAIDALEKKTPDQPMPHLLRGRVLVQKKDVAGATRSFEAALAKDPAFFPAVASLAALDLAGGKPEDAKARFEAFQKAQPKSFQAKLAMAELQARTGANSATVIATLREAVKMNAGETLPHLILIRRLIAANDSKGALVAAQEASAALPNDIQIQESLGEAQIAAGDGLLAVSTFKKLSSAQPKNTLFMVRLADAHRANKDPAAAEVALRQALEVDPDLTSARGALIGLALQAKRPQDALALARDQQKRKPNDPAGFQLEAEIEASRKNWDETVTLLRTAAKLQNTPALTTRLHSALVSGGKSAEADRLAAEWTRDHPKDMVFKFYLGDVAMARQDFPGAEALYRQVIEAQPTNALALNNVAWLMARQNKPGAVAMAEKANALMPDRAPLVDTLSLALETENQLPKAIEAQVRATRLEPSDPNLTLRLGKLYIKSGDKARARAELEALVKLGEKFAGQAEVTTLLKQL